MNLPLPAELRELFSAPDLLRQALRHSSCGATENNERLEYLGDAVLGLLVAEELCRRHPGAEEGTLSQLRSVLVCGETLAEIAREQSLEKHLCLHSGTVLTDTMLAGALEAIFGALYLDRTIEACRTLLYDWFGERMDSLQPGDGQHPKSVLKEYLEKQQLEGPVYTPLHESSGSGDVFVMECTVPASEERTVGEGQSRRAAERAAAEKMLAHLSPKN